MLGLPIIQSRIVTGITEQHSVYGKKFIEIETQLDEDELVVLRFAPAPLVGNIFDILRLYTVSAGDTVEVSIIDPNADSLLTPAPHGYFTTIKETEHRPTICRCGASLWCDGFDVYCTNQVCPLTVESRIITLSDAQLLPVLQFNLLDGPGTYNQKLQFLRYQEIQARPFKGLANPLFWGNKKRISDFMFERMVSYPIYLTMESFLTPYGMHQFIDSHSHLPSEIETVARAVGEYHQILRETCLRRDYSSAQGNYILFSFLKALQINYLDDATIEAMIVYECSQDFCGDPMAIYASLLTSVSQMVHHLGVSSVQAESIRASVMLRKLDLFSIFTEYAASADSVAEYFERLNTMKIGQTLSVV